MTGDWRLNPIPSHIGRFSEIESRARMYFRVVQPCEDDYEVKMTFGASSGAVGGGGGG